MTQHTNNTEQEEWIKLLHSHLDPKHRFKSIICGAFVFGSYVNGYFRNDSDIDICCIISNPMFKPKRNPIQSKRRNKHTISIHCVPDILFNFFNSVHPYTHQRMVPLINPELVSKISNKIKFEIVRRFIAKHNHHIQIHPIDPIIDYLETYSKQRPWRLTPIKRMIQSEETIAILDREYSPIIEMVKERKMIIKKNSTLQKNPNFMFNTDFEFPKDSFKFKFIHSWAGLHYLRKEIIS